MLLRFGCENYKSFRDYQELSLVASALKDPGPDLFSKANGRISLLPLAVIYGANASGKSNTLLICPLLSGPKSMLFWIMKEVLNAIEKAQAGGDYRQAA
jgi:hypothetical protein